MMVMTKQAFTVPNHTVPEAGLELKAILLP